MRRKTRFVCVSDTHGYTPAEAGFKLPAGDVLIHAGDLTNQGRIDELRKTVDWIAAADFEVKIVICGNHDITLDPNFYTEHGSKFHGNRLEDHQKCIEVVTAAVASSSIVFLRHESALVRLTRPNGPNTIFKVFGSPYSQSPGSWAYGYESTDAAALWSRIPLDADIVVTHTPPHSHCDSRATGGSVGCKALRQVLSRVRPSLAICGHVHESRGYERVRWSFGGLSEQHQVIRGALPPPGSKKQSLIDLTGKKAQQRRLGNDDFFFDGDAVVLPPEGGDVESREPRTTSFSTRSRPKPDECPNDSPDSRSHRWETCIVNAAILATSWPHRGGKRFNTPIVVDLELPTWRE
ncbi:Metallo-dependent phosphatase-like protein [Aspergillus alliaceus]|uniref:Metallo-dependent phosphatase-like protein n=1 Tax=Petromyces alliaceus TaxID=209559 RepID=A0A5N6G237_PETAA|nr:Metallo-dependent phosphatase-like protein [Aspergillus alliaceus]KAB8236396.1 Metallo-dependent phosphatase-like protein [Aspergillus alliaceus]KAE8391288.1 Metallo-dependent phosphatase-like protein [Aspergillus alliaceus]